MSSRLFQFESQYDIRWCVCGLYSLVVIKSITLQGACEGRYPSILYIKPCMPLIRGYGYSLFWWQRHLHHIPAFGELPIRGWKILYNHRLRGLWFCSPWSGKVLWLLQAFIVARCSKMFGQTVDSIRAAVSLLVRIQRGTVCFYQPIYASILRINEVVYEIPLRPVSQFTVGSIAIHPVGGWKSPRMRAFSTPPLGASAIGAPSRPNEP